MLLVFSLWPCAYGRKNGDIPYLCIVWHKQVGRNGVDLDQNAANRYCRMRPVSACAGSVYELYPKCSHMPGRYLSSRLDSFYLHVGRRFTSSCACARSHSGLCSPLILSIVPNNCVSGQQRPWSDCADAQADLGLRCPHMPGTVHISL